MSRIGYFNNTQSFIGQDIVPVTQNEAPEIDIFSASILDVLKDIGKEVGNAGKDISKGAISLIRQPTSLSDRMRIGNNFFFRYICFYISCFQNELT